MVPYDPIIDDNRRRKLFEEIVSIIFETDKIEYMKGKANIKNDMRLNNCHKSGKTYTAELKARGLNTSAYYSDIAVEVSQYHNCSDKYKDMCLGNADQDDILHYLSTTSGAGWLFHTKAKVIIILARYHVDVINFPVMKKWLFNNFKSFPDIYCDNTTGSYNKIFPYNKESRKFTHRFDGTDIQQILKEIYRRK